MVDMSSDCTGDAGREFIFVDVPPRHAGARHRCRHRKARGRSRVSLRCRRKPGAAPRPLERHSVSDFVFLRYNRSGQLRYLSVSESDLRRAGQVQGLPRHSDATSTERASSQKALEKSEARYRMLFDIHPQPMWVV